jgi:hypothetical protein
MGKGAMRIVRVWITMLSVGMGVVGCAGGPQLIPVTNPTERLELGGFSILPPQGGNWFKIDPTPLLRRQNPTMIALFHKTLTPPSKSHTVTAWVRGGRVVISAGSRAELLEKLARTNFVQTERHRPVSVNISPDKTLAPECVRYDGVTEDRGVPGYPGSIFIWDQHGFVCFHPDLPDSAIDIQYNQRRLQEEAPLSLEAEGDPFLKSLTFSRSFSRSPSRLSPPSGKTSLILIRPSHIVNLLRDLSIRVSGLPIVELSNGSFTVVYVEPGKVVIESGGGFLSWSKREQIIEVSENEVAFAVFRLDNEGGGYWEIVPGDESSLSRFTYIPPRNTP